MEYYNKARVGNIVGIDLFVYRGEPFLLTGIINDKLFNARNIYSNNSMTIHTQALLPVPITTRRLQKLLFKQVGRFWMLGRCSILPLQDSFEIRLADGKARIKAVHQLQNFYLAFAKEELALPFIKENR